MHTLNDSKARVTPRNRATIRDGTVFTTDTNDKGTREAQRWEPGSKTRVTPRSRAMLRSSAQQRYLLDTWRNRVVMVMGVGQSPTPCSVVDERLLKLTMPGRAYTGPLTSAAVDRTKHAVVVGNAALREISEYVIRADNRVLAAASVDTQAFVLCLLPWVLGRIDAAWAAKIDAA
jgi:hypothetical protein